MKKEQFSTRINTISSLQVMLTEQNAREKIYENFKKFCDKYESVEGVFARNGQEITNGFLDETKEYESLYDAAMNWTPNESLHITQDGKYILGEVKTFNECQNKIFDISLLKYFN